MHNFTILHPIDNTELEGLVHKTYSKGYSEYRRLFIPNQGLDNNDDMVHYHPYGVISINDKVCVPSCNIFLRNGYLEQPGVIVEKYYVKRNADGVILGDEQYFRVIDSNIDSIKIDSLVIVMADKGHRFNIDKDEFFYIKPEMILVVFDKYGIRSGPHNMLLKRPSSEILGISNKRTNKGTHKDFTYYFDSALYDIVYDNIKYVIVATKDIKIIV